MLIGSAASRGATAKTVLAEGRVFLEMWSLKQEKVELSTAQTSETSLTKRAAPAVPDVLQGRISWHPSKTSRPLNPPCSDIPATPDLVVEIKAHGSDDTSGLKPDLPVRTGGLCSTGGHKKSSSYLLSVFSWEKYCI